MTNFTSLKTSSFSFLLHFCGLVSLLIIFQLDFVKLLDERYNDYWRKDIAAKNLPDQDILIIEVDDKSLVEMESQYGRWQWPRSVHGFLVEGLLSAEANAIVFDIMFSERDIYQPDHDTFFAQSVSQKENVFFPAAIVAGGSGIKPTKLSDLPDSLFVEQGKSLPLDLGIPMNLPWVIDPEDWNIGLIDFFADSDGIARRYPLVSSEQHTRMYSLPQKVARYIHQQNNNQPQIIQNDMIYLKYKGVEAVPFNAMSYVDALWLLNQQKKLELFKNKIVIIGATATGLHDLRETPIMPRYPATSILATALDNSLNNDFLVLIERVYAVAFLLLLISILFFVFKYIDSYKIQLLICLILSLVAAISLYTVSYYLSYKDKLFPSLSTYLLFNVYMLGIIVYRGFKEYLKRQHALQTFSRFMDPVVVKQLVLDKNWQQKLVNKTSDVSVLFSDIRGFTSLSEKRSAEQVIQILNAYFDLQVSAIFETRGTLDKFIGDAVMAFWGAPLDDSRHAINAVTTALKMQDNLNEFCATLPDDLSDFDIGIGVHSGKAVVGMLGSSKRFDYTAIGDTVNLASRIEGVTKGVARILISEATKELCDDTFCFHYSGEFSVKGRKEKVRLYQPAFKS